MKKKVSIVLTVCAVVLLLTGVVASKNIGITPFGDPPFPLVNLLVK